MTETEIEKNKRTLRVSQSCRAVRHTELVIKGHINMGANLAAACGVASAAHNTFWRYYPGAESYPGIVIKRGEKTIFAC